MVINLLKWDIKLLSINGYISSKIETVLTEHIFNLNQKKKNPTTTTKLQQLKTRTHVFEMGFIAMIAKYFFYFKLHYLRLR